MVGVDYTAEVVDSLSNKSVVFGIALCSSVDSIVNSVRFALLENEGLILVRILSYTIF